MKLRKIFVGMTAAAIALSCMTVSASAATDLFDVCYPASVEENKETNDAYYSIGAMAFFMNQQWKWNQSEWVGIDEEGIIKVEFSIGAPMADTTMSGKGTLGDMGIMLLNLPEDGYPYNVKISDAKFVAEDGTETALESVNAITEATLDPEGGFRIHIRPTDEVDEDTGEVKKKACPEVAGWDQEGAFNGGVLSMTIDLNVNKTSGEDNKEEKKEEKKEETKEDNKKETKEETKEETKKDNGSTAGGNNSGAAAGTGTGGTAAAQQESNAQTGAASNAILAAMAMAAAGAVASKKRK